jgi:hypothetical protein
LRQHLPLQLFLVPPPRAQLGLLLGVHLTSLVDTILASAALLLKMGSPDAYARRPLPRAKSNGERERDPLFGVFATTSRACGAADGR